MKKAVFVLILILGILFGVFCQSSRLMDTSGPMDLVVLLDTSASMSNSYRETSDYLIGPFLREFLRLGDTFHLISFAGSPRVEISRRVEAVGDVEAIIGRILLMYPLYLQSDVSGALSFAERYSSSLPDSRYRKIILISDGDFAGTQDLVNASSGRLRNQGSELQYIRVPVTGNGPSSGRPPAAAATVSSGSAQGQTTEATRQTTGQTSQPVETAPQPSSGSTRDSSPATSAATPVAEVQPAVPVNQSTPPVIEPAETSRDYSPEISGGPSAPAEPLSTISQESTTPAAAGETVVRSTTQGETTGTSATSQPSSPSSQAPAPSQPSRDTSSSPSLFSGGIPLPLIIALIILILLILGLLIFFLSRHLHNSPNRVMAQAALPMDNRDRLEEQRQEQLKGAEMMDSYAKNLKNQRKPLPKDQIYSETEPQEGEGPLMLNLFVEDQNTAIGRRNIHALKSGYSYSVGGGKSDFLIFLVPIPPHIADIQMSGNNCNFVPRKPQYFPDIGSQTVSACIGKSIRVISDKQYELHIRMERYEDPLKKLNKMLHSISVPGEVH